jgi:hypothetical protein
MPEEKRPIENGPEKVGGAWELEKVSAERKEVNPESFGHEQKEGREVFETKDRASQEELQKEIEKVSQSPQGQQDIKQKVAQIKDLDTQGKLSRLLSLAQERGVAFAISVAKEMNDPYLLDTLHDGIIEKGIHKKEEK